MNIGESIGSIYDTVLRADQWPRALDAMAKQVGIFGAMLAATDKVGLPFALVQPSGAYEPWHAPYYLENFGHYDEPVMSTRLAQTEPFVILTDEDVWGDVNALNGRPDYKWMWDTFGVRRRAGVRLSSDRAWVDLLALQLRENQWEDVPPSMFQSLSVLLPHLAKAVELNRTFTLIRSAYSAVLDALDRFRVGVCVISQGGFVVARNKECNRILELGDGLYLSRANLLRASDETRDNEIREAVARAASTAVGEGSVRESVIYLERKSLKPSFVIEVAPLKDTNGDMGTRLAGAVVFLIDPDNRSDISTERLGALFGLTTAEALVTARLVEGYSTAEIADIRNTSPLTVRTQVKSIYAKTRVSSRSDLVRLAVNVDPPIDRDPS